MKSIKLGKYRHYKGKEYEIITVGKHSETLEDLVVYRGLYDSAEFGPNPVWIRPLEMFLETVNVDGQEIPRFKQIT